MKRLVIFFVLSMLLFSGNVAAAVAQNTNTNSETYIILYDQSHFQYFTTDRMSTALNSLNSSLDHNGIDVTIKLIKQEDTFNSTNLQGADLVLITNPGSENGTAPTTTSKTESQNLYNLVEKGGKSIFYLSNPMSYDGNITGHVSVLNNLIYDSFGASIFTIGGNDNGTVMMDDFNNVNHNSSYVVVNATNFNKDVLVSELNNITAQPDSQIIYYGSTISESGGGPGQFAANVSKTGYVVGQDFSISRFQDLKSPRWLYGRDYTSGGRVLLTGSTIMFSDLPFDNGTTSWVNQAHNLQLFQNMVAWLLGITPLPTGNPVVNQPFSPFFLQQDILWAFVLSLSIFAVIVLVLWRQNKLDLSNITNIFMKGSSSNTKTTKSEQKSTTTTSKKTKRRKRN